MCRTTALSASQVVVSLALLTAGALSATPTYAYKPGFEKPTDPPCQTKKVCTQWRGIRSSDAKVCMKWKQVKVC